MNFHTSDLQNHNGSYEKKKHDVYTWCELTELPSEVYVAKLNRENSVNILLIFSKKKKSNW